MKAAFLALAISITASAGAEEIVRIPDDTTIVMERGNCEGGCPVYRVVIFADGDVLWQGRGRVAKLGPAQGVIEWKSVRALLQQFQDLGFSGLENVYGFRGAGCKSMKPDMPTVVLSLVSGGAAKTISHHDGCVGEVSEKLGALEDAIDRAAHTNRWIEGGRSPNK
jgi:hypothetical protein